MTVILLLFRNMNGKNLILFVKVTDPPDVLEYLGMSVKFLIFVEASHVKKSVVETIKGRRFNLYINKAPII